MGNILKGIKETIKERCEGSFSQTEKTDAYNHVSALFSCITMDDNGLFYKGQTK